MQNCQVLNIFMPFNSHLIEKLDDDDDDDNAFAITKLI